MLRIAPKILAIIALLWCLPVAASAKVGISQPLMLAGKTRARVKLPGAAEYVELTGIKPLPPESLLAPDAAAPLTILCPDLTKRDIAPGAAVDCPKSDAPLLRIAVKLDWDAPPPSSGRAECEFQPDRSLSREERARLAEAERELSGMAIDEKLRVMLLASLHATFGQYVQAITAFEEPLRRVESSEAMRILGTLQADGGNLCQAGNAYERALELAQQQQDIFEQAICHERLAGLNQLFGQLERAQDHARQAITCYQHAGFTAKADEIRRAWNL